ncbi:hypothetical protein [Mycobacterium sp.]|uniref:hypothetical protein n=1 Tax=Mycobacterium sp. TaxID=1785 RepID=UPI003C75933D
MLVDSGGIHFVAWCPPSNMQDPTAFPTPGRQAKRVASTIAHVRLNKGTAVRYQGIRVTAREQTQADKG